MTKKQITQKRQELKWEIESLQFKQEMKPNNFTLQEKNKLEDLINQITRGIK
jgi:hypothetical protein